MATGRVNEHALIAQGLISKYSTSQLSNPSRTGSDKAAAERSPRKAILETVLSDGASEYDFENEEIENRPNDHYGFEGTQYSSKGSTSSWTYDSRDQRTYLGCVKEEGESRVSRSSEEEHGTQQCENTPKGFDDTMAAAAMRGILHSTSDVERIALRALDRAEKNNTHNQVRSSSRESRNKVAVRGERALDDVNMQPRILETRWVSNGVVIATEAYGKPYVSDRRTLSSYKHKSIKHLSSIIPSNALTVHDPNRRATVCSIHTQGSVVNPPDVPDSIRRGSSSRHCNSITDHGSADHVGVHDVNPDASGTTTTVISVNPAAYGVSAMPRGVSANTDVQPSILDTSAVVTYTNRYSDPSVASTNVTPPGVVTHGKLPGLCAERFSSCGAAYSYYVTAAGDKIYMPKHSELVSRPSGVPCQIRLPFDLSPNGNCIDLDASRQRSNSSHKPMSRNSDRGQTSYRSASQRKKSTMSSFTDAQTVKTNDYEGPIIVEPQESLQDIVVANTRSISNSTRLSLIRTMSLQNRQIRGRTKVWCC